MKGGGSVGVVAVLVLAACGGGVAASDSERDAGAPTARGTIRDPGPTAAVTPRTDGKNPLCHEPVQIREVCDDAAPRFVWNNETGGCEPVMCASWTNTFTFVEACMAACAPARSCAELVCPPATICRGVDGGFECGH